MSSCQQEPRPLTFCCVAFHTLWLWVHHGDVQGGDRLVYYSDAEYKALTGLAVDVQTMVERPYIHLLAAASSSVSDTIAFTANRLDCVRAFGTTPQAEDDTEITGVLRFFNYDEIAH